MKLLEREQPDLIVCTHFLPAEMFPHVFGHEGAGVVEIDADARFHGEPWSPAQWRS